MEKYPDLSVEGVDLLLKDAYERLSAEQLDVTFYYFSFLYFLFILDI